MALDDLYSRLDAAVVERIQGLGLVGDDAAGNIGDRVYSLAFPDPRDVRFPAVLVFHREPEERVTQDTEGTLWRISVPVAIADQGEVRQARKGQYLRWRLQILEAFDGQDLPDVTEVLKKGCEVVPQVVFDERLPQYMHVETGLLLRFLVWVARS